MNEISLTKTEFKALSSQTRVGIMKALLERNYTLSELSAKIGMSAPTIKEHTNILSESGIVELQDEGRKWKYYSLTRKGRDILEAKQKQTNVLIILSCCGILLAGMLFMFYGSLLGTSLNVGVPASSPSLESAKQYADPAPGDGAAGWPRAQSTAQGKAAGIAANVRCVPMFDESTEQSAGYATRCHSASTEEACLSVDYFSDETEVFGNGDGKPDCRWKLEQ